MAYDPAQFAEKYRLALETAQKDTPDSGVCGLELEWNLMDAQFRPVMGVGSGPAQKSFVDYLRSEVLSPWLAEFSQLEIFHWMVEWATRPYYSPRGTIYESRLIEAVLLNSLAQAGKEFGEELYAWHGNLLALTQVSHDSIPSSWHIAKRRYLERCVNLYGDTLATAGLHSNLSLPEPLLAWDFVHLPAEERGDQHLDDYKNHVYISGTRLMRAFSPLFIATSASTPLQAQVRYGRPVVVLTEFNSVRNLTFPNPAALDLPDLYRTYQDYLQLSYDLVRRQVRFGNNNWTPVRARSFAEPVERLIAVTSDELRDVYAHGLYSMGETAPVEEMARQIEIQNLLARINLPMGRVEVRTDDGGNGLDLDVANLTFKYLLLLRFYADDVFARNFRYDREDISRARRNEEIAAKFGLNAEIENPLTGKPAGVREFLKWTLGELKPLAEALELWEDMHPLMEMAEGGPNTAERLRTRLRKELGGEDEVPVAVLRDLAEERQARVIKDVESITERQAHLGADRGKLAKFIQHAREAVHGNPLAPIRFRPRPQALVEFPYTDKTAEVVHLAQDLIRIPSVTASPEERLDEVKRAATFIYDYLQNHGAPVRYLEGKYPAVYADFGKGNLTDERGGTAEVMLAGHFDVVPPEPDGGQFEPRVEGDYLWGRGAADMKTVVATFLVWWKDTWKKGPPFPPMSLLLVGNEENGEAEPMGTPHTLRMLEKEGIRPPNLFIAGERTGEKGNELYGEICTENRGIMRFDITARGVRGHSGVAGAQADLADKLLEARREMEGLLAEYLTLEGEGGWQSQARFPFIQIGTPGMYNITPDYGVLGVEVRSIPQDNLERLRERLEEYCRTHGLGLSVPVMENGVMCDPQNKNLIQLIKATEKVSGEEARIAKKLPGTSARFAPGGQGIVWGQSGIGPHSSAERHFIPSIDPYYRILEVYGRMLGKGK